VRNQPNSCEVATWPFFMTLQATGSRPCPLGKRRQKKKVARERKCEGRKRTLMRKGLKRERGLFLRAGFESEAV